MPRQEIQEPRNLPDEQAVSPREEKALVHAFRQAFADENYPEINEIFKYAENQGMDFWRVMEIYQQATEI